MTGNKTEPPTAAPKDEGSCRCGDRQGRRFRTSRRMDSGERAAPDRAPRPPDLTYRLPLPPSGPQWTVQDPGPVGRVVGLITTFGPLWIGTEPRPDWFGVTTALGPRWTFEPPAVMAARQVPL